MKTKFNLSTIMKRAHEMFKERFIMTETFGDCLRQAWANAKAYAQSCKASLEHGVSIVNVSPTPAMSMDAAIAAEYAAGTNGRRYFGD